MMARRAAEAVYLPEPDDLFAAASVMPVDGVSLPVHQVDLLHPAQHHLREGSTLSKYSNFF